MEFLSANRHINFNVRFAFARRTRTTKYPFPNRRAILRAWPLAVRSLVMLLITSEHRHENSSPLSNLFIPNNMQPRLELWLPHSAILFVVICLATNGYAQLISNQFRLDDQTQEQIRWRHESNGVRGLILAPKQLKQNRRSLVVFATPNGNTLEQTLGCQPSKTLDWRYDIQHVAAQMRWLRNQDASRDYILAVVQPSQLSWPEFRRTAADANRWIAEWVESMKIEVDADEIVLACHSGGGSFLWGWMKAYDELPEHLHRLIFLDANYSFSIEEGHDRKLVQWLSRSKENVLVVIAYDDREIQLNGKQVVGADGGTYRASERMLNSLSATIEFSDMTEGSFRNRIGLDGRVQLLVHQNPDNKILHTALVGEMNGVAVGMSLASKKIDPIIRLSEPRVYGEWIQAEPFKDPRISSAILDRQTEGVLLDLPPRSNNAETGSQFCERVAKLEHREREKEVVKSILSGNVPMKSRDMAGIKVSLSGKDELTGHATYYVMRDYMAIGSDEDYVRMPLTPNSAMQICDRTNCLLITEKISDDVYSAAECRVEPHPMTSDREQVSAFVIHNNAIEDAIHDHGESPLVAGIKKDLVITNRLKEKSHRVAIYGWHYSDGRIIQPLYVGHVDWYTDYSHGLRLMSNRMLIDGTPWDVREVLMHDTYNELLSREGPIDVGEVRSQSEW